MPNSGEQPDTEVHIELPAEATKPELETTMPPANREWDNAAEQEWNEHSTTAWALAHVIHRICSTPLPPILPPEQRRHFQKVVHMAAALMEEWQCRERDQAQQLVAQHSFTHAASEMFTESQVVHEEQAEEPAQTVVVGREQE